MTKARDLANSAAAFSAVSATELGYVDGVTSAIQTQLDAKADSSTAVTLTGTQTLTNKTLTSPALTTPTITTLTTNGDLVYGTGSGALSRLGIGSSAQILTVASGVPSWATPAASASGLTLISSTSFTTSSGHSVNSCFSATYANYRLVWTVSAFSASNVDFLLRLRVSGTDATTNYVSQLLIGAATTAEAQLNTSGTDDWTIGSGSTNNAYLQSGSIDMFNPYAASATQLNSLMNGYYGANNRIIASNCINTNATSYDGITLLAGSGTITGTLRIYGYQNS